MAEESSPSKGNPSDSSGGPKGTQLEKGSDEIPLTNDEKEEQFHAKNPLWKELMKSMNCLIDHFILRILDVTGYKTYQALKEISSKNIEAMEMFVKGDDILTRVEEADLPMYLGPVKERNKFSFTEGEKTLILHIAGYVKENYVESKKPLGNVSIFSIFKKRKASGPTVSGETPSKKTKTVASVVSYDVPSEVAKIKKIIREHCVKKQFPKEIINALPRMTVEIKTVELQKPDNPEGQQAATLSGKVLCCFCKKYQSCTYDKKGYWITSNVHRHLNQHVSNKDYLNSSGLNFKPVSSDNQNEVLIREDNLNDISTDPANSSSEANNSEIREIDSIDLAGQEPNNVHLTSNVNEQPGSTAEMSDHLD